MDIKKEIHDVYKSIMLNENLMMDSKSLNYWTKSISKHEKTIDDLKMHIVKSQEYATAFNRTFIDLCNQEIEGESSETYPIMMKEFRESVAESLHLLNKDDLTTSMLHYIHNTEVFKTKIIDTITKLYITQTGEPPSTETVDEFLQKYVHTNGYGFVDMYRDIWDALEQYTQSKNHGLDFGKTNAENGESNGHIGYDFSDVAKASPEQIEQIKRLWSSKDAFVDFYMSSVKGNPTHYTALIGTIETDTKTLQWVDVFESVYGRPMNVREFLFYAPSMGGERQEGDVLKRKIENMHKTQQTQYVAVKDLMLRFVHKDIDEEYFIKHFLVDATQKEGFLDTLQTSLLCSDEYKTQMCERMKLAYNTMYAEQLPHVEFVFEQVKLKGCDLIDDTINVSLVEFKSKIDDITEHIFKVYMDTLEREPDNSEVNAHFETYLNNIDTSTYDCMDDQLADELKDTLEYHDVIKNKIKAIHLQSVGNGNENGTPLLPSQLYKILQMVVHNRKSKTFDNDIADAIAICT